MPEYTGQIVTPDASSPGAKPYTGPINPIRMVPYAARKEIPAPSMQMQQMDPGVDYSGWPNSKMQATYSLLDTPQERTAYLVKQFGPNNVTKDSYGHDVILSNGKRISFSPRNAKGPLGPSYASLAGDVAPVAGMVAGGAIGSALGGVGAIGGAGAGGAAGTAVNKLIKDILGYNQQTSSETAKDIVGGFAQGATAEAGGQLLGFAGRSLLGPYRPGSVFGPWKRNLPKYLESSGTVKQAIDQGLRVRVGTAAPNAIFIQRLQNAGFRIFGDEIPNLNRPVLEKGARNLVERAAGTSPTGADAESLSKTLSSSTESRAVSAQAAAEQAKKDADVLLNQSLQWVSGKAGTPTGKLAGSVSNDIRFAKDQFSQKASLLYAPIDEAVGKPVVPTQGIKDAVNSILDKSAKTVGGQPVALPNEFVALAKKINQLPDHITFQQMQGLRSAWSSMGNPEALNVGLQQGRSKLLAAAADRAFDDAQSLLLRKETSPILNAEGKQIKKVIPQYFPDAQGLVRQLRNADSFYKAGIKRFSDMSVEALVKDATQGGMIQPEKVAQYIATPGQTDKLLRIKKVVTPETFREIGAEKWSQMVQAARDPVTGQVDGVKLSRSLYEMSKNGMLDTLYGKDLASQMRELGRQFAVLNGRADASVIGQGNIRQSLQRALDAQTQADTIMSTRWVKAIRSDGPESLQAAQYLTRPENRLAMRQFLQTFGKDSVEAQSLREYLAREILSKMEQPASRGAEKYASTELMGEPLLKELDRYGRPYLEEVFGKEWTNDAYRFAKTAEVASRKNPVDSGGLIAAMLGLHPIKYLGELAHIYVGNELLSTPAAMKWLTEGIGKGPEAFFRMLSDRQIVRTGIAMETRKKVKQTNDLIEGGKTKLEGELNAPPQGNQ